MTSNSKILPLILFLYEKIHLLYILNAIEIGLTQKLVFFFISLGRTNYNLATLSDNILLLFSQDLIGNNLIHEISL